MKYYIDGRVEFTEEDESEGSDSNENEQDNVE